MIEFIDETADKQGTPLNRANMMAIQGFIGSRVKFNDDGSITEINNLGETTTTEFLSDRIVETFEGEKTITKQTLFGISGYDVVEVIS